MNSIRIVILGSLLLLVGNEVAAQGSANPASVNFGNVPLNTTVSQNIAVTVDAGYSLQLASGSGLNAPFHFSFDACGANGGFPGPGTCNAIESFTPTAASASSGTLVMFECPVAGGSCIPISIPVSGTGISVSEADPTSVNFGSVPINTTVERSITITVDAGYRTQIASGSGINVPFGFSFDTCGAGGGFAGPGTCTVKQRFTPTAATASSGTTNVFECPVAGGTCIPISYSVSGTGITTAAADPASVNFGTVPINTTVERLITITVDAGYRTQIASGGGINAPFSFSFDTCGAGGGFTGPGTCTVRQRFTPTSTVTSSGTTNVFECPVAGGSCIPISYSVNGTGGSIHSADPTSVDFGNVPINTTVERSITITVDAGYSTQIASGGGINAPFGFSFDTCGAGGGFTGPGTCTVKQRFTPTSATASSGTTNVFECPVAGGSCIPISYSVSGTGITTAAADPASVNFGNVPINTTVERLITITVDAGYRTEIASGGGINAPFSFSFDTCGTGGGFAGPATCTVKQRFTPTAAVPSSGTTNVFECPVVGGSCIPISYSVSGTGVSIHAADPSTVDFGNVPIGTTAERSVTITVDAGYRTQLASGTGINLPFSFDFDSCGTSGGFTGPGVCTVKQRFTPTSATASSGTTNVFECPVVGGSCIPISYSVTGSGISTRGADPASVDFGDVPINTTVEQLITITVDAGYRTQLASGSGINVPFSFDFDSCGAGGGFAGPGTCTVKQRFTPNSPTTSSGTTNVFECPVAGGTCLAIPYSVTGTGVSSRAADPASINFGSVPINTTAERSITITVDAGYRTQLASGSGINVPFGFDFDTCGTSGGFAGPGTCTVKQRFTPTSETTSSGTTNVFECPVAGGTCLAIPYSVTGTGISVRTASPSSINFGTVPAGTTAEQLVTITVDAGYRTQLASGSGINTPFGFDFDACGTAGGFTGPGTCTVKQRFTPNVIGPASGTTNVFECPVGGGTCLPITYSVSGTGSSVRAANPSSVDFGNVVVGSTSTRAITLTVDNGYRVTLGSGAGINPPFSLALDSCGAGGGFVGPGTCTIQETFAPTSATSASGTLTVSECPVAGGTCLGIDVSLAGRGIALLSITTASLPSGVIGTPYPATTLQTSGGTPPVAWSIVGGALPSGLTLDPSTGEISGTPTTSTGVFAFTVAATDAGLPSHQIATRALSITILKRADLFLDLDAPKQIKGKKTTVSFSIKVRNFGPDAAGAIVTDVLPAQTTFVSAETKYGTCTTPAVGSTGTVTCTLNPLAVGSQAKIDITVEVMPGATSISNTASVAASGDAVDQVPGNNTATVTVQIK